MSTRTYAAMVRFALWVCGCAFVAPGALAQCTNPTAVPNGTYTTGDHSVPPATALSAGAFVISGSATATFSATNCIHLGSGFSASAGGANTFQASVDVGPTAVSVTPSGSTACRGPLVGPFPAPPAQATWPARFWLLTRRQSERTVAISVQPNIRRVVARRQRRAKLVGICMDERRRQRQQQPMQH